MSNNLTLNFYIVILHFDISILNYLCFTLTIPIYLPIFLPSLRRFSSQWFRSVSFGRRSQLESKYIISRFGRPISGRFWEIWCRWFWFCWSCSRLPIFCLAIFEYSTNFSNGFLSTPGKGERKNLKHGENLPFLFWQRFPFHSSAAGRDRSRLLFSISNWKNQFRLWFWDAWRRELL